MVIMLLSACGETGNKEIDNIPGPKATVVFDNTQGSYLAVVYRALPRTDNNKIVEIPAGQLSAEIDWNPGSSVPFFFSYKLNLIGISDFTLEYVADKGLDQTYVRIDENKKIVIPIPSLNQIVSPLDEPLTNNSYIYIQNNSSIAINLSRGSSVLTPDNLSSDRVNSGERVRYTITNSGSRSVSLYSINENARTFNFPGSLLNFEPGRVYNFVYDGSNISLISMIDIKLENTLTGSQVKGDTLAEKLEWLKENALSNMNYIIGIDADVNIVPQSLSYNGSNIYIEIIGINNPRTITLAASATGSLFTVHSGVTLILDNNITLIGHSNNNDYLVKVNNSGTLEMKTGSRISQNRGGGVHVDGIFNLNGGEITGNTGTANGGTGGVNVNTNSIFNMNSGTITRNVGGAGIETTGIGTNGSTGGVNVNGLFNMKGGSIINNTGGAGGRGREGSNSISDVGGIGQLGGNGGAGGVNVNSSGKFDKFAGSITNNTGGNGGRGGNGGTGGTGTAGSTGWNGGRGGEGGNAGAGGVNVNAGGIFLNAGANYLTAVNISNNTGGNGGRGGNGGIGGKGGEGIFGIFKGGNGGNGGRGGNGGTAGTGGLHLHSSISFNCNNLILNNTTGGRGVGGSRGAGGQGGAGGAFGDGDPGNQGALGNVGPHGVSDCNCRFH